MAQRQFRIDDTDVWKDRYGTASAGNVTISSSAGFASPTTTCTGTISTTAMSVGSGSGFSNGDLLLIHQTQDTSGNLYGGNWELNKISSGGGTTSWTLAYSLTHTYLTGAQVIKLTAHDNFTVNASVTVSSSWNGSKGGIIAYLASNTIAINGILSVLGTAGSIGLSQNSNGGGFRGGGGASSGQANRGESTVVQFGGSTTNLGSEGGGGKGGYGPGEPGDAGQIDDELTTCLMFGGSGGGSNSNSATGAQGGNSGGIIVLIARRIIINSSTGVLYLGGGMGGYDTGSQTAGGGGGGGGCALFKGQYVDISANRVNCAGGAGGLAGLGGDAGGGGAGATDSSYSGSNAGGPGTTGRLHVDYSGILSGSTSYAVSNSRRDTMLADPGGAMMLTLL